MKREEKREGFLEFCHARLDKALRGGEADFRLLPRERGLPVSEETGPLIADGELIQKYALKDDASDDEHHVFCSSHGHTLRVRVPVDRLKTIVWICPVDGRTRSTSRPREQMLRGLTAWGRVVGGSGATHCPECRRKGVPHV